MSGDFNGLRAIVTGGASGIGAATARWLTERGATVAVFDLAPTGAPVDTRFGVDITDDHAVRESVAAAVARLGGLDVLINNAGIGAQGTIEDNADDEWRHVLDVNLLGTVRVTRACMPALRDSPRASIVNTCSVAATVGLPDRALYSASKGAIAALTLAMAADCLAQSIRVNCVAPGTADTPWIARLLERAGDPDAERAALEARQPHGRLVSADEVAVAIGYLAGPAAGSTTGTMLVVDGGLTSLRLRSADK
jgi:NAD(P)-dependent dehydrogenase (short-subunit alcohol dehydrogenase family)